MKNNTNIFKTKKTVIVASMLALMLLLLALFHYSHPYFYSAKWLRMLMYSLTFVLPLIMASLLGLAKIHIEDTGMFIIMFFLNFIMFYFAMRLYSKSKHKKRFIGILIGGIGAFAAISMYLLW